MKKPDPDLIVVLVEPSGPLNIGSIARLCANFGVRKLRLVQPRCDYQCDEAIRMAVHGQHILREAEQHHALLTAISDCSRTIATCGRLDHGNIPLHSPEDALSWLLSGDNKRPLGLVFGREDSGLTNHELRLCQRVLTLHSHVNYPSLNLSHAVAVVMHDIARISSQSDIKKSINPDPASVGELMGLLEDAKDLLTEVGFLLEHTASSRMSKVQDLLLRASTRPEEVALIRGMVRQLRWAIRE